MLPVCVIICLFVSFFLFFPFFFLSIYSAYIIIVKLQFLAAIKFSVLTLLTTKFSAAFSVARTHETLDLSAHAARALLANSKFNTLLCHH